MIFQLRSKENFKEFLESPETKALYEQYKNNPTLFIAKFASKSINELYDANPSGNYNYAKTFRIFADAPHVTEKRDYRVEAVNCARLIDSGLKPEQALKTNNLPEIQSLSYNPDTKEMTLTFANLESPINFEALYREIIKPSSETLKMSELSVTLPLADYNYLKDNRFLKFKLETVPKQHSEEEDLIDFNTGEYRVLKLIRDQQAIVRLHNTLKNKENKRAYEGELDAMEHPMDNRYVAMPKRFKSLLAQPEGENTLINQRKKVQHPLTREERIRGVQLEPAPPLPQYQQPQIPELDHPDLASKRMFEVRGGAKNTRFLTKAPYTLLEPTGNTQLFMGAIGSRNKYFPIGILSDIDQTHKGGETYIWTGRANSWEKHWLGDKAYKLSELPQGLSLEELKKLQREGEDPNEHNELLLRSGKVATRALVTPKNTLIDRLNLAVQAINIKRQFSISLPLIILDPGDPECPKPYTEDMIRQDIQDVVKAVRDNSFEFDRSEVPDIIDGSSYRMPRDKDSQNEIIAQLLNECGFNVQLNPDQNLLPENKLSINSETPEETDAQKIDKFLQNLSIPGGKVAQMQQIADAAAFDALATEKKDKFFIKQAALGHAEVIERLLNTTNYRPSEEVYNKAISIAYIRHGGELANHLVIQLTKAEVAIDEAVLAADEVAIQGAFPTKHSELDTAVIAFQKLQKQLAPLAYKNDLMSKAETAMKQIHPDLWDQYKSDYKNIEHYYAVPLLEVLRQLDKAEARLKRSIGEMRRIYPLTEQLAKSLQIAQKLVQSPDKLKENAIETYLTQEDQFNLIDEVLEKYPLHNWNSNILKDMFYTVTDKRNTNLSYSKQMKLALARWQLSNPPMSVSCANYLKGMTTFLFREQSKIKVSKIIDALWNGKLGDLIALDPEIGQKFNRERISYSQPSLVQMEHALFHWKNHNVTKKIPMSEACKSYLRAMASQASSEKTEKILTTLWNGNFSELLNLSPQVAKLFIAEGRNENHPLPAQVELALAQWQVNDLTKNTTISEVNKGYLREIVSQSPSIKKIKQLVSILWKGDLQELFELVPQIREQFIKESREKISSCIKDLHDLQPELIKTKDDINNQKALVLKKAQEIFDKSPPDFKDKRLIQIEHRALNTAYQETLARLEKQFDDLNIDALETIQQISVDFSKCLSVQQVEVEGQRLTLDIEKAKKSIDPALDSPLLKKALEAKAAEIITASNDQIRVVITKTFKEKHQAMFEKDKQSCFGKWRNTTVTKETSLEESIKHAKESNNRTRQAFIDLGWMNKKGEVTKSAPDLMQKLSNETAKLTEGKSIVNKFKKLAGTLQNPEKNTETKGLSKS
jgi:hypothetical protein